MKLATIVLLAVVAFTACNTEDPPLFTIPVSNLTLPRDINPAMSPLETHYFTLHDVSLNAQSIFDFRGMDTADIKNILPYKARVYAAFGEADLEFLNEVQVFLCPRGQTDVADLCGTEVFYNDQIPFDAGFDVDLFASNVNDIRELILEEKIDIRVVLRRFRTIPPGTFSLRLDLEFAVR
jgi:hypothetical protein